MNIIEAYKKRYHVKNSSGDKEISFELPTIRLTIHRKTAINKNIYTEHFYINTLADLTNKFFITDFLDMFADDWEVVE